MEKLKNYNQQFWNEEILLYLDAVSFVHKNNPHRESLRPKARVLRKPNEGLIVTAKGSKDLAGGDNFTSLLLFCMEGGFS